jgi:hypothetical protein
MLSVLKKIGLVSHIYNEELLLPTWLEWHKPLVDYMYLIDHSSTDRSVSIIKELAPEAKIITSWVPDYDASGVDRQVSEVEHLMKEEVAPDWIISLNTSEFLFTPNLREKLECLSTLAPDIQAFGMRSVVLVDKEENNSLDLLDHNWGYVDFENGVNGSRRWRYIHNWLWGNYHLGRHGTALTHTHCPELLILYAQFMPFPLCKERKAQQGDRRSDHDKAVGNGHQHGVCSTDSGLMQMYNEEVARSFNLLDFPLYKEYYGVWRQRKINEKEN